MTQVYLAVLAPEAPAAWTHALIAKKRVINRWWRRQLGQPAAVNQAGQWALPGGAKGGNEDQRAAAKREFQEETGVDLQTDFAAHLAVEDYPFNPDGFPMGGNEQAPPQGFSLVVLRVSTARQSHCCATANTSIGPKPVLSVPKEPTGSKMMPRHMKKSVATPYLSTLSQGALVAGDSPLNGEVQDWELSSLLVVGRQVLGNYLGVHCPLEELSPSDTRLILQRGHDSQDISWYKQMAAHLTKTVA